MSPTSFSIVGRGLVVLSGTLLLTTLLSAQNAPRTPSSRSGWTLPPAADTEKNPLPANDAILAAGRKLFVSKCQRCHGPQAKGNGPDADKKHQQNMDLTSAARATENPDGVVFYKVWNGRSAPRMPRLSEEFSREQVWAIVAYVQSIRGK